MARLWTGGGETGHIHSDDIAVASSGGGFSYLSGPNSSPTPRSGLYTYQSGQNGATTGYTFFYRDFYSGVSARSYYFRLYFRISNASTYNGSIVQVTGQSGTGALFTLYTNGPTMYANVAGVSGEFGGFVPVSTNTWHKLDICVNVSSITSDYIAWKLDEVLIAETTAALTSTLPGRLNYGIVSVTNNTGFSIDFDDVAINDDTGSYQNNWIQNGHVAVMEAYTNAGATITNWVGGNNNAMVNSYLTVDTPPAGLATATSTNGSQARSTATGANAFEPRIYNYNNYYTSTQKLQLCYFITEVARSGTSGNKTFDISCVSNPGISIVSTGAIAATAGAFPGNWYRFESPIQYVPSVTDTSYPNLRIKKTDTNAQAADCCLLVMQIEYSDLITAPPKTLGTSAAISQVNRTITLSTTAALQVTRTITLSTTAALRVTRAIALSSSAAIAQLGKTVTAPSSVAIAQLGKTVTAPSSVAIAQLGRTIIFNSSVATKVTRAITFNSSVATKVTRAITFNSSVATLVTRVTSITTTVVLTALVVRTISTSAALLILHSVTLSVSSAVLVSRSSSIDTTLSVTTVLEYLTEFATSAAITIVKNITINTSVTLSISSQNIKTIDPVSAFILTRIVRTISSTAYIIQPVVHTVSSSVAIGVYNKIISFNTLATVKVTLNKTASSTLVVTVSGIIKTVTSSGAISSLGRNLTVSSSAAVLILKTITLAPSSSIKVTRVTTISSTVVTQVTRAISLEVNATVQVQNALTLAPSSAITITGVSKTVSSTTTLKIGNRNITLSVTAIIAQVKSITNPITLAVTILNLSRTFSSSVAIRQTKAITLTPSGYIGYKREYFLDMDAYITVPGLFTSAIFDNFSLGSSLDLNKWRRETSRGITSKPSSQPYVSMTMTNNQFDTGQKAVIKSQGLYNFTGSYVSIEIIDPGWPKFGGQGVELDTEFGIIRPLTAGYDERQYLFSIYDGKLQAGRKKTSAFEFQQISAGAEVAYNSYWHRYLRLRHNAGSNEIYYECSPDFTNWYFPDFKSVSLTSFKVTFSYDGIPSDFTQCEIFFGIFNYQGAPNNSTSDPYIAKFDSINAKSADYDTRMVPTSAFIAIRNPMVSTTAYIIQNGLITLAATAAIKIFNNTITVSFVSSAILFIKATTIATSVSLYYIKNITFNTSLYISSVEKRPISTFVVIKLLRAVTITSSSIVSITNVKTINETASLIVAINRLITTSVYIVQEFSRIVSTNAVIKQLNSIKTIPVTATTINVIAKAVSSTLYVTAIESITVITDVIIGNNKLITVPSSATLKNTRATSAPTSAFIRIGPYIISPKDHLMFSQGEEVTLLFRMHKVRNNKNAHAHIMIGVNPVSINPDGSVYLPTFNFTSYEDTTFEYDLSVANDGSGPWQPITSTGVPPAYQERIARVKKLLPGGIQDWRVRMEGIE